MARKINTIELYSYRQSVKKIGEWVQLYFNDLKEYQNITFSEFFDIVKNIEYQEDGSSEIISRPRYIFEDGFADCKKKSILIASFCELKKIGCRFVVSSTRSNQEPHHIYTEVIDKNGKWIVADATYNNGKIGRTLSGETYREVYQWLTV